MHFRLVALIAAVIFVSSALGADPTEPAPPLSAEQLGKLIRLIDGPDAHQAKFSSDLAAALRINNGRQFSAPAFSVNDHKHSVIYEFTRLPQGGYVLARGDGKIDIFLKLDGQLNLDVAAKRPAGSDSAGPIPNSEAQSIYEASLKLWGKIADKFGSK